MQKSKKVSKLKKILIFCDFFHTERNKYWTCDVVWEIDFRISKWRFFENVRTFL